MADETNGNGWKTFGIISGIVAGIYLFISLIRGTLNPRKWFSSKPYQEQSAFEKCEEANKAKPDGTDCSNCVPEGSGQPVFNGVIKDGKCLRIAQPASVTINLRKIRIKANGAIPYSYINGNFVSPKVLNKIPAGTVLTVLQVATSSGVTYYNTAMGWISGNDISEVI